MHQRRPGLVVTHFFFNFCIFRFQNLGWLSYAKVSSESLAKIEQNRISLNRNTMVVNEQFIKEGHVLRGKLLQHKQFHGKRYPNLIEQKN